MKLKQTLQVTLLGLALVSCSGSSSFGGANKKAAEGDKDSGNAQADENSSDSDEQQRIADEPAQVAGAYLTCAFMDSKEEVSNKVKTAVDSADAMTAVATTTVDVGCGLYDPTTFEKSNVQGLNLSWQLHISDDKKPTLQTKASTMPYFDVIAQVPIQYIVSSIEVDILDDKGAQAIRRRSVDSITQFDGRIGFNPVADMTPQKSVGPTTGVEGLTSSQLFGKYLIENIGGALANKSDRYDGSKSIAPSNG